MPETISVDDAQYAFDIVKEICTQVGPGLPGSSQERERAAMIKRELVSHLGAGNVVDEEFTFAPGASLNPYPALFMLLAVLLNISVGRLTGISPWVTAIAALAFSIISPLLFVSEFIFGFELVDRFFKKTQSINVIGTLRKPGTQTVKRLLILSGHHDSAPENTWFGLFGDVNRVFMRRGGWDRDRENTRLLFLGYACYIFSGTFFLGFATMLVMSLIQLTGLITGNAGIVRLGTLGWGLLVFPMLPALIYALFAIRGTKNEGNVPGAVDNLSACALAVAMCRFLAKNPVFIPEDTEIRFITFGSEEVGLRGSRRYVERHLDELKSLEARLLNCEMVAYPEIAILTSEVNGTVKNSPEMVKSVAAAAQRAGVPYKVKPASIGTASDAGPFSRAGLQATTLIPFQAPQQLLAFYHQKWDRPEVMTIEPLLNVLKLYLEWVRCGGIQAEQLSEQIPESRSIVEDAIT
jgi:hypothetical protein